MPCLTTKDLESRIGDVVFWHAAAPFKESIALNLPLRIMAVRCAEHMSAHKIIALQDVLIRHGELKPRKYLRALDADGLHHKEKAPCFRLPSGYELIRYNIQKPKAASTSNNKENDMSSATVFDNCISVIKTAASYSVKTCSSAEAAVLLSNLVQISLGKKYPAILKAIPYYREVEPMLLSIIVLGIAEYINHPQSAKLSKVARYAIQGEMQRLVRPLVGTARSLIEDLISTQEVEDLLNAVDGMPVEPEETA